MDDETSEQISAEAWAFVLEHVEEIERHCRGHAAKDDRVDFDELRQEVALHVARHHASFDPSRGTATTWIWWQARRCRTRLTYDHKRGCLMDVGDGERLLEARPDDPDEPGVVVPLPDRDVGGAEHVEDAVAIGRALDGATINVLEACEAIVQGWSAEEVARELGVTPNALRGRLRRFRRRLRRGTG